MLDTEATTSMLSNSKSTFESCAKKQKPDQSCDDELLPMLELKSP